MRLSPVARARTAIVRTIGQKLLRAPMVRTRLVGWRARPIDGNVVDAEIAAMLAVGDVIGASEFKIEPVDVARAMMAESAELAADEPCEGVHIAKLRLEHDEFVIPARQYVPRGLSPKSPCVVYYHGGGWVLGDLDTHDRTCQRLAHDAGVRVISVDYRLAPENPYPAAVEDAVAAFRSVAARAAEFDIDSSRIAVMGDSAGGNLAAVVSRQTRGDEHRPALQALVYPALDATRDWPSHELFADGWVLTAKALETFYNHYLGADLARRRDPDVSPLLATDLEGLPTSLVYTAGFDPLRDEGNAYAEKLLAAGIATRATCFETMIHGFAGMGGLSLSARTFYRRIAHEVGQTLRKGLSEESATGG